MTLRKEPLRVGGLTLQNRLVLPPMATAKSEEDGTVSEALCAYYGEKTRGGYVALVVTEHAFVSMEGRASRRQLSISRDGDAAGLRRLTDVLHANGSAAVAQINHAGAAAVGGDTGCPVKAPSAVRHPRAAEETPLPVEMTRADIADVVAAFAAAARRAKAAGFDGVEIHSAHGYLLNQFYSPLMNRRADGYGGAVENRVRIHLEVIRAVRAAVGADFPVALRLGACDYTEGGNTRADAAAASKLFAAAGVGLMDVSGGMCGYLVPGLTGQGFFAADARAVREASELPTIVTGGVTDADGMEQLLAAGDADLVGVGRAILKDSDWPSRYMA